MLGCVKAEEKLKLNTYKGFTFRPTLAMSYVIAYWENEAYLSRLVSLCFPSTRLPGKKEQVFQVDSSYQELMHKT
jgi:hypothetical protein